MSKTTWKRLLRVKNDGGGGPDFPDSALVRRVYGAEGELYPRLLLAIHPRRDDDGTPGISIDVSRLKKSGSQWTEYPRSVPVQLVPELAEMMLDALMTLAGVAP